jgi:hypothetical protein
MNVITSKPRDGGTDFLIALYDGERRARAEGETRGRWSFLARRGRLEAVWRLVLRHFPLLTGAGLSI